MLLTISIKRQQTKAGSAFMVEALRLTACGSDPQDAKMKLQRGIVAWCRSLDKIGQLEDALRRANLEWAGKKEDDLRIVMEEV